MRNQALNVLAIKRTETFRHSAIFSPSIPEVFTAKVLYQMAHLGNIQHTATGKVSITAQGCNKLNLLEKDTKVVQLHKLCHAGKKSSHSSGKPCIISFAFLGYCLTLALFLG